MASVEVFHQGTAVRIGPDVEGIITAVMIRGIKTTYEVVWWNGRQRQCEWLDAVEIVPIDYSATARIGFR